jgi:hypothetical protein
VLAGQSRECWKSKLLKYVDLIEPLGCLSLNRDDHWENPSGGAMLAKKKQDFGGAACTFQLTHRR